MVNFEQVNVGWEVGREMSAVTSQMDIFSFSFFFSGIQLKTNTRVSLISL